MALSNWDTFAMNEKGESCKGVFKSPLGVVVKIYKNWIYVEDEVAWQEGTGCHSKPVIMEIFKSELQYKDVHVVTDFIGNAVYVCCWSGYEHIGTLKGMIGIGAYGFDGEEYVGVRESQIDELKRFIMKEKVYFNIPLKFSDVDLKNGKRFNQGDMLFHDEIGIDKQCSEIGKANEPILGKVLKEMNKKEE